MKYQRNPILVSVFLMISALFLKETKALTLSSTSEVEDGREYDYLDTGGKGPQHWGDLKTEWAACKDGKFQSPIDLTNKTVKVIKESGEEIRKMYKPAEAVIKNRGHDISLQWPKLDAGFIKINGTEYVLQQVHWHSPSEHTFNGIKYALEVHMVHVFKDPQGKENTAVVGQLYNYGAPDEFLATIMNNITHMIANHHHVEVPMGVKDPNIILAPCEGYFRYLGSLTVPPCTEGVLWTIGKKLGTVSKEQIEAMREVVHDYAQQNARPVQPLNSGEVYLYGAKDATF